MRNIHIYCCVFLSLWSCKSSLEYDKEIKIFSKNGYYINIETFAKDTVTLTINEMVVLNNVVFPEHATGEPYISVEEDLSKLTISISGNSQSSMTFKEEGLLRLNIRISDVSGEFNVDLRRGRFLYIRKYLLSEKNKNQTHRIENKRKRLFAKTDGSGSNDVDSGKGYMSVVLFQFPKAVKYD